MAIWSTNFVLGRVLRNDVSPATISAVRALVAGVPLGLWVLARHGWPHPDRRLLPSLIVLGFVGVFACQYLTYTALHFSPATNVTILNSASPLVTAALVVLTGMAAFSRGLFAGLVVSTAGAALVSLLGQGGAARVQLDPGALIVVASMIAWGFYNVLVQRLGEQLPPLTITATAMLTGFPFVVAAVAVERPPHLVEAVRAHLGVLVYLSIGPSAVAYWLWSVAVRDIGAGYAMLFNNAMPIFGMLLGGLVLHESVTIVQVVASALIVAGILLAVRTVAPETKH
jgi:drug/metabolite transporter (DMT)-like permease